MFSKEILSQRQKRIVKEILPVGTGYFEKTWVRIYIPMATEIGLVYSSGDWEEWDWNIDDKETQESTM